MYMKVDLCQLSGPLIFRLFIFLVKDMKFYLQYIFSYINFKPANVHMFNYVVKPISLYLQIALGYFDRNPGGGV